MGRQRVPTGQIFLKKDEKVRAVIAVLSDSYSEEDFVAKFREIYPDDWEKVVARWNAHERLTPPGKNHPMARPEQYMINTLRATVRQQKKLEGQKMTEQNKAAAALNHEKLDVFLGSILDLYKLGRVSREDAIGAIAHVIAAVETQNASEIHSWLHEGSAFEDWKQNATRTQ